MNKASEKMVVQNVRGSYLFAVSPRKKDNGDNGGYGVKVLIQKDDPQLKKLNALIKRVFIAAFGEAELKKKAKYKLPIRDAEEEGEDGEEYENVVFFNANNKQRKPGIVNRNNEPADQEDIDELCYSGAYFHVSCNFYSFPAKDGGKPGIAVGFNNLMLRKKGERLDGTSSASSDFENYADNLEDFDDDLDDDDEW